MITWNMAAPQATGPRMGPALLVAAVVGLLGFVLEESCAKFSYDQLHAFSGIQRNATADSPVVIVYLDLPTYLNQHRDPTQLWPRELHAQLVRRLTAAKARAVVFDIVFGDAGPNPAADQALADALRENGRAILAAEFSRTTVVPDDQHNGAQIQSIPAILPLFREAAAAHGLASQRIDDDNEVRRYLATFSHGHSPSLTWATAKWLHLPVTSRADKVVEANHAWLRYYGPPLTIPHISYTQVLEEGGVADDFFRDKIVFIGARLPLEVFNQRNDEFRNPFHSADYKTYFMPGVEVHATEMLNLIRRDGLRRMSPPADITLQLAVALLFGGGLLLFRPIPATIIATVGAGLVLVLGLAAFGRGIWFSWLVVGGVQIPAALFGSWLWQFQDWFLTRRKLEAAKRIADAKIREQAALIDKAHDAILVWDLAGTILYANPGAEKLYGWKLAEMLPDSARQMFSAAPEAAEKARMATLRDGEWNGELAMQTRAGQVITVDSRWTLIRDDQSQPCALLQISIDVTEKKSLEQQFLRAQRMNTIGTLAGGMAHDLNNALSPVLLGTQLLRRKTTDAGDLKLLTMMESSTHRGAEMVQQVLLFARGRGGQFERIELPGLVNELEKMVRETFPKNITIEKFLPRDLRAVWGNPTQVHQVLLNLSVNARDAMPAGGQLSLVADNVELTEAEAAAIPEGKPGRYVSLAVADTGMGMPPEVKAKIFEPFFTTKGEGTGTGIGLATVARILHGHHGFLRVESEPGQGTSFEVFLPCAPEVIPAFPQGEEAALPRGHGELILLVDDEVAICELVAGELREFGYRVVTAGNGADAIAVFRQHSQEVRVFVTDSEMPVMGGAQALVELRKLNPKLPAIFTGGEQLLDRPPGVFALTKPFALPELLGAINRTLNNL